MKSPAAEKAIVHVYKGKKHKFKTPLLVLMMGLPGSGKSHIAYTLARKFSFHYLAADNIRLVLTKHPVFSLAENKKTYTTLYRLAEKLLRAGKNVILEGTMLPKKYRQEVYEKFSPYAHCILLFAHPPKKLRTSRLQQRQENLSNPRQIHFQISSDKLSVFERELEAPYKKEAQHVFRLKNKNRASLQKELQPLYQLLQSYQVRS